jgi:hypothetical protein
VASESEFTAIPIRGCSPRASSEQGVAAREAHHHLAGRGQPHRSRPHQQALTQLLLEQLDALAHRRGCEVLAPGGGLEGPLVRDQAQRFGEGGIEVHPRILDEAWLHVVKRSSLVLHRRRS